MPAAAPFQAELKLVQLSKEPDTFQLDQFPNQAKIFSFQFKSVPSSRELAAEST